MIGTAPVTAETYQLAWSGDPALDRSEGFDDRLDRARLGACTWESICTPGQVPTIFVMRRISGSVRRRVVSLLGGGGRTGLTDTALMFRLAIADIAHGGPLKVEFGPHPELGVRVATETIVDILDAIDPGIVTELGLQVFRRMETLPLS